MRTQVFLGGTVANSTWRGPLTEKLVDLGVERSAIFNPVVDDWTPECQAMEDACKAEARFNLFYLCAPQQPGNPYSIYSLVEAVSGLYDKPSNTVVVFDNEGYEGHALKALKKCEADLRGRFPNGYIFNSQEQLLRFFANHY